MAALQTLLETYVADYGFNLKAIRDKYCQCGGNDLNEFKQIYKEELKNAQTN